MHSSTVTSQTAASAEAPADATTCGPEALARYFRVLGDPTRLRIVEALLAGPRTVSELTDLVGASQSRVSNHLACLKWCKVAESAREGRTVSYRITDERIAGVLATARRAAVENCDHLASCTRIGPDWV